MGYIPELTLRYRTTNNGALTGLGTTGTALGTFNPTLSTTRGNFYVTGAYAVLKSLTGSGTLPIVNIGTNSGGGYNNIVSSFTMTKTAIGSIEILTLAAANAVIAGGTTISVSLGTAGTGYTAITYDYFITGFYEF